MISLIVAMSENRVIGFEGDMPWRLSKDLRRFKQLTMGHHIVMGRKTYESIGRPLPGRTSVVISRTAHYDEPNVLVARNLEQALDICSDDPEPFITGGAQVYALALPKVDRIYLTRINCTLDGDTHFPDLKWDEWNLIEETRHSADDKNQYDFCFMTYDRNLK